VKDKSKIVRIVFAKLLQKPVALLVGFFLLKCHSEVEVEAEETSKWSNMRMDLNRVWMGM